MNLRTRARKMFGREKSEHAVVAPKVHNAVFNDLRRRSTKVDDIVTTMPKLKDDVLDGKVWERLCEDVFSEFFGEDDPTVRARDKVDPRFRVNRELADKTARSEKFAETHAMTRGQRTESALGWMNAMESLADSYGNELAEYGEQQNEISDASDHLDSIDDQLDALRQQRPQESDPSAIDQQVRDLAGQKRQATADLKQAVAAQQATAGSMVDAVRGAVAKAGEAAEDGVEVASMLPGSGEGSAKRLSDDAMLAFADRVSSSDALRAVLAMMGRMKLSMGSKRRQLRRGGNEEMVDIETGNDLQLVLPQERALLVHPVARLDFYRRFQERSLMQYEMWSEQDMKKGPLIVIVDGSGSMAGAKNTFARGLSLAALSIAHDEGRNAAAIEYGAQGEIRVFFFDKDEPFSVPVALDFAEHFFGGGTDTDRAFLQAYDLIHEEAPFHTADLLLITDGLDTVGESSLALRDKLEQQNVKRHGIAIGMPPTDYLLTMCSNVSSVFDYAGPNSTSDRLAIDLS